MGNPRLSSSDEAKNLLTKLGVDESLYTNGSLVVHSPIDGAITAQLPELSSEHVGIRVEAAEKAFKEWRKVPAPKRGELVRLFGDELRSARDDLGRLVSIETGKVVAEGVGEVQEMIDICEFATGLSRQLYGV